MGLGDILFGDSPSTTTEATPTLTNEQRRLLDTLLRSGIRGAGERDILGFDQFLPATGREGAPQLTSLAALEEVALNRATGQSESDQALSSILRGEKTGEGAFDDFFETNIQTPAVENFQETVLPQIGRRFGGSEFFGSERRKADQDASSDLLRFLTAERARGELEERQFDINTLLEAVGLAQERDISGRELDLEAAIALNEQERANFITEFEKFFAEQGLRGEEFNQLLALIQTPAFENIVFNDPGSSGLVQGFLSGGNLAGAFGKGGVFSGG